MFDLWTILLYIGLTRPTYLLIESLYSHLINKISLDHYKYGWVLITGASDGIGKELAVVLAKRGFKLILVSRNKGKLEQLAKTLGSSTGNPSIH